MTVSLFSAGDEGGDRVGALRWAHRALPTDVLVYVATVYQLKQLRLPMDGSDDPSGARDLVRLALAEWMEVATDAIELHPPKTAGRRWQRPRPGFATVTMSTSIGSATPHAHHRVKWLSLSRSPGVVAVAFADRRIGIDIEAVQTAEQSDRLLTLFHPRDRAALTTYHGRRRREEISTAWARKEAIQKTRGIGLLRDPAKDPVGTEAFPHTPRGIRTVGGVVDISDADAEETAEQTSQTEHVIAIAWSRSRLRCARAEDQRTEQ